MINNPSTSNLNQPPYIPPMQYPYVTIPKDTIEFIKGQQVKINQLEMMNGQLMENAENWQKKAMYADARCELMKTKIPNAGRVQFLAYREGKDPGLMLVTKEAGKVGEALICVCNSFADDAAWVESEKGESYLAVKFCHLDRINSESTIFIPEAVYDKNGRLLSELSRFGIALNCSLNTATKATLWREYLSTIAKRRIFREVPLGWFEEATGWKFITNRELPWWDWRKRDSILEISSEKVYAAMEKVQEIFVANLSNTERVLSLLPFAAKILQLLVRQGYVNGVLLNLVMKNFHPSELHKIKNLFNQTELIRLPMKASKLKEIIYEGKSDVFCVMIDALEVSMAEKNLLRQNFYILQELLMQGKLSLVCSMAPVWIDDFPICIINVQTGVRQKEIRFEFLKAFFEKYLVKNANYISKLLYLDRIPSELGSQGWLYELFRVTRIVVRGFLEESLNCKLPCVDAKEFLDFFQKQANAEDRDGLGIQVIYYLQRAVETGTVAVISPYETWRADTVIVSEEEVYFRKETLKLILRGQLSAYNERTILRALYEQGYLVADAGIKTNYTTRRRCTDKQGEAQFMKFVVLKKERIVSCGDYDFLT